MAWINIGDINPKAGTTFVSDMQLEDGEDFRAQGIEVTPESHVGGSDSVFLIRSGELFVAGKNIPAALEVVGARLEGRNIVRPDHHGGEERIRMDSPEGLLELAQAANGYTCFDDHDAPLVRIGMPSRYDPEPRFDGEMTLFTEDTSIWAILREMCDGFDLAPEDNPRKAVALDAYAGPFSYMPRKLETRADLANVGGFRDLERDEQGNPKVYLNRYRHEQCPEAKVDEDSGWQDWPEWESTATCGQAEECPECGEEVMPYETIWIGPSEVELQDLWEELPEKEAVEETPEPGF